MKRSRSVVLLAPLAVAACDAPPPDPPKPVAQIENPIDPSPSQTVTKQTTGSGSSSSTNMFLFHYWYWHASQPSIAHSSPTFAYVPNNASRPYYPKSGTSVPIVPARGGFGTTARSYSAWASS